MLEPRDELLDVVEAAVEDGDVLLVEALGARGGGVVALAARPAALGALAAQLGGHLLREGRNWWFKMM